MGWFRRSQIAGLFMVCTLGCQITEESPSQSVWRRSDLTPLTAPAIKPIPKDLKAQEEQSIPDQPAPKPVKEKPVPFKPVVEIPPKDIVQVPEKRETPEPKKVPSVQEQAVAPKPIIKEEKSAVVQNPDATREMIAAEESLIDEITGLIIEQTMTRIGYDFYEYFFILWEEPQLAQVGDYNIYINERASPLWGSWVWVAVNDTIVWQKVLRPRAAEVEDAAREAIEATKQYLMNYEQYVFQSEDIAGTGI